MSAFFSGTDNATLVAEGTDSPHFVSLIVCNNGPYVAKITRRVTEEGPLNRKISYPTFDGDTITSNSPVESHSFIEAFPLTICMEEDATIQDSVNKRYDEIMALKKTSSNFNSSAIGCGYEGYGHYKNYIGGNGSSTPSKFPSVFAKEEKEEKKEEVVVFNDKYPHFNTTLLKAYAGQILFGSITVSSESFDRFDKAKWVETNMEKTFDKRFGSTAEGFMHFKYWVDNYIDTIMNTATDPNLEKEGISSYDIMSILASDLIEIFEKLLNKKPHKYLDEIIEVLTDYVFIDEDNYDAVKESPEEENSKQLELFKNSIKDIDTD